MNAQAPSAIAIESTPSTVAMLRKEQQLQRSTPHLHMQKRLLTLVCMDQPPATEAGEHRQGQRELFSRRCQYHRLPRLSWIRKRSTKAHCRGACSSRASPGYGLCSFTVRAALPRTQ